MDYKAGLCVNTDSGLTDDHFFERQMLSVWGDNALRGGLWDDVGFVKEVPFDFFTISLQQVDASGLTIQDRMMDALGSNTNRNVMTLMVKDANLLKEKVSTRHLKLINLYSDN